MKILCRAKVTPEDMGYSSMEKLLADCAKAPHLRPCSVRRVGRLGGWVYKDDCAKGRCKFFEKVIHEEGDEVKGEK